MTTLDQKIARLYQLKPTVDKWYQGLLDELCGGSAAEVSREDLREYWKLEKEITAEIHTSGTLVHAEPLSRQYIKKCLDEEGENGPEFEVDSSIVHDLYWSRTTPEEYVRRLWRTQRLYVIYDVPPDLKNLVDEARSCAASEHYNAVAAISRTIFEAAITDIAVRTERIPPFETTYHYYRDYPPHERLTKLVNAGSPDHKAMTDFYAKASSFIHGSRAATWKDASDLLERSLEYVEQLYARYHRSLPPISP